MQWLRHLKFRKKANRSMAGNTFVMFVLLAFAVMMAFPLVYAIMSALKPYEEIFIFPPKFYVVNPTADNFYDLFAMFAGSQVPFLRYVMNSIFVTVTATVLHIFFASMAAYPMAKNQFRGKKMMNSLIMTALLFVPSVTALPRYIIMAGMGLIDSYMSIILPFVGGSMGLFLMQNFMSVIPNSLLEAARIDGASEFRIYYQIVMPNVKPAWLTLLILTFNSAWNSTGGGFIFTEQIKMLPTAISQLIAANSVARMGVSAAASVFLMIPPIALFIISQSNVLQTMAHAGIKE